MKQIGNWQARHLNPDADGMITVSGAGRNAAQIPVELWQALQDAACGVQRDPAWYPKAGDVLCEPGGLQIIIEEIAHLRDEIQFKRVGPDGDASRSTAISRDDWRDLLDAGNYRLIAEGAEVD